MKTAAECLEHAFLCERRARATLDRLDRRILIECAKHWRTLASTARPRSVREPGRDGSAQPMNKV
jgi:hypothetical protein